MRIILAVIALIAFTPGVSHADATDYGHISKSEWTKITEGRTRHFVNKMAKPTVKIHLGPDDLSFEGKEMLGRDYEGWIGENGARTHVTVWFMRDVDSGDSWRMWRRGWRLGS